MMGSKTKHTFTHPKPELIDVLNMVERHYSTSAGSAGDSKALLALGVEDEVAQYWKNVIENPMGSLYEVRAKLDGVFMQYANTIVKSFLSQNKRLIDKAFRTDGLFYCIVLKKDNMTNRMKLNSFFSLYFELAFSKKYPVEFQFVPKHLAGKLHISEEII